MALFHVLVWKPESGERREPVAKYMIEAESAKSAIDHGNALFVTQNPDKRLKDHLVQAFPG
jgi:hypothetical protein